MRTDVVGPMDQSCPDWSILIDPSQPPHQISDPTQRTVGCTYEPMTQPRHSDETKNIGSFHNPNQPDSPVEVHGLLML